MMRYEYTEEDWARLTGIKDQPGRPQDGDDRQAQAIAKATGSTPPAGQDQSTTPAQ